MTDFQASSLSVALKLTALAMRNTFARDMVMERAWHVSVLAEKNIGGWCGGRTHKALSGSTV